MFNHPDFSNRAELVAVMKVLNQHSIVSTTDADGRITYVNDRFCEISGYTRDELLGQNHQILSSGKHPRGFFKKMFETTLAGDVWQSEVCNRAKDGRHYWLRTDIAAVQNPDGTPLMFVSIQTDITSQRKKYEQLELLQTCIDRINDVVIISEAEPVQLPGPRIVYVNKAFERLTGYSAEEAIGNTPRMLQGPASNRPALDRIHKALARWKPIREEVLNYTKDNREFWSELDISPIADETGWFTHWVSVQRDVTARKAAEAQAHELAYYDALTKLPNRRLLLERLTQTVDAHKLNGKVGALLFIDLDGFKSINEAQDYTTGDLILQQAGSRIVISLGGTDTVAHLGGDKFIVILDELGQNDRDAAFRAEKIGDKLLASLSEPYPTKTSTARLTASIGIALLDKSTQSIEELLKQAEIAMYQSKRAGRNCLRFFDPIMQESIERAASTDRALQVAIDKQQFQLAYQVQVDALGHPTGAEALIRWISDEHRVIMPGDFIPRAEENGLIIPIGQWILDEACRQLEQWSHDPLTRDLTLSINVSARQFFQPDFVEQVAGAIELHGTHPEKLEIELTESVILGDVDSTVAAMSALKRIGVKFSLDDFGVGYSSLQYLKKLPIDQLKIDRSFVNDIATDSDDRAIIRTIIAMATSLGLDVIAEGVETQEQLNILSAEGCVHFQGYLFSKPVPISKFEMALKSS